MTSLIRELVEEVAADISRHLKRFLPTGDKIAARLLAAAALPGGQISQ